MAAGSDFDIVGKITVDQSGATSIQGLSSDIDRVGASTSALGTISDFVWAGIILKGIEAVVGAIGNAISSIGEFFSSSMQSAMESQDVMANVTATITSTGGAAGYTAQEIADMALALQEVTRFSDETIMTGQAMLLTFTNIGHDVFPLASEAMLDLAAKFGSVESASIMLGKALQDPIAGVTALRRVGVMLSEEQENSIKLFMEQGDIASAQKVILQELGVEVGGLAVAMGTTLSGQMEIANNKLDNFKELVGGPLLVAWSNFKVSFLGLVMESPAFAMLESFLTEVNSLLQSGAPLLESFGIAFIQFGAINPIFQDIGEALISIQDAIDEGRPIWQGFFDLMSTLFGPEIAGGITTFVKELSNLKDTVITAFETGGIGSAVDTFIGGIIDAMAEGIQAWISSDGPGKLSEQLISWVSDIGTGPETHSKILAAIGNLLTAFGDAIAGIDWGGIADAIDVALANVISRHNWSASGTAFGDSVASFLTGGVNAGIDSAESQAVPAIGKAISDWFYGAVGYANWTEFSNKFVDILQYYLIEWPFSQIKTALTTPWIYELGHDLGEALLAGLESLRVDWNAWWDEHLVQPLKDFLGISSPSTVFFDIGRDLIQGLINGISSMWSTFLTFFTGLLGDISVDNVVDYLLGNSDTLGGASATFGGFGGGTTGGTTGTHAPAGSTTGQNVVNNFYGPVYIGSYADLQNANYDCPQPNPILAATAGNLVSPGA